MNRQTRRALTKATRATGGRVTFQPHVPDWEVSETWRAHGRILERGTEVTIRGERGRFRFQRHVRTQDGREWVDVISDAGGFRAFRPERIRTVHRTTKTRANAAR